MAPLTRRFGAPVAVLLVAFMSCVQGFNVAGYVPEYRMRGLDWEGVLQRTTHVILFSLEPQADGSLHHMNRLDILRQSNSPLREALAKHEGEAPKLLMTIGGAGRSSHFAAAAGNLKSRKRLASQIAEVVQQNPLLAGIDLDWEIPQSVTEWRAFAKLARDVRATMDRETSGDRPMLTMTFHPNSGSVGIFSALKSKKAEGAVFTDIFDMCHCMAYAQFSEEGHSPKVLAEIALDEWRKAGLPMHKFQLGLPFFGINKETGAALAFSEILDREPSLSRTKKVDKTKEGTFFNNVGILRTKVKMAQLAGAGGVTVWELGQDKPASGRRSLLGPVWEAANADPNAPVNDSFLTSLMEFSIDEFIGSDRAWPVASLLIGAIFMLRVTIFNSQPKHRRLYSRRAVPEEPDETAATSGVAASYATPLATDEVESTEAAGAEVTDALETNAAADSVEAADLVTDDIETNEVAAGVTDELETNEATI